MIVGVIAARIASIVVVNTRLLAAITLEGTTTTVAQDAQQPQSDIQVPRPRLQGLEDDLPYHRLAELDAPAGGLGTSLLTRRRARLGRLVVRPHDADGAFTG